MTAVDAVLVAELAALSRRLRAAEDRLRDEAAAIVPGEGDASAVVAAAVARHEGFACGLALAAAWLAALRDRLPELAALAARVEAPPTHEDAACGPQDDDATNRHPERPDGAREAP